MAPIRKGDGTPLEIPGVSEVRSGDGRVFFEGDAIPDSVVLQYFATTYEDNDDTWEDDLENQDMSISGVTSGQLSDGNDALDSDGTDDHGTHDFPSSLEGSDLQGPWAIELAVEYDDDGGMILGVRNDDEDQLIHWNLLGDGNFLFMLDDNSGNQFRFEPDSNPGLDDGNRHDITVIVRDTTDSDAEIIIDGDSVDLAFDSDQSPDNFTTWDRPNAVFARNDGGNITNHTDIKLGAIRWHDQDPEGQTIDDYP